MSSTCPTLVYNLKKKRLITKLLPNLCFFVLLSLRHNTIEQYKMFLCKLMNSNYFTYFIPSYIKRCQMKEKSSWNCKLQIHLNFDFNLIIIHNEKTKRRSDADDVSTNKRQTVQYNAITSYKTSLGPVVSDKCWKAKFRSAVKTITEIHWCGSRAFCDYFLFAVTTKRISIETKAELKNTIRACYIIHTKNDDKRGKPSSFFNNVINKELYDGYLEDYNGRLLDKHGLTNIISHDVNDYTV